MSKLYIVGIGSGNVKTMTIRALECIKSTRVVVGYHGYIELIKDLLKDKIVISSGMGQEVKRCRIAVEKVKEGYDTCIVSSGDAGLYGMAGLVLEIESCIDFEVVPGVSAAFLAASCLGAPLMDDMCTVSLSDHLTPWEVVKKRLVAAAQGDFVIALYNPRSILRPDNLERAVQLLLSYRDENTPVGIVKNAGREGESVIITTLGNIKYEVVDMMTTLIVGNSRTYIKDNTIITPRGYPI
ncbi:precorrin-3B C(17)-methyltransferase [Thermovenabulum sp.]|uniref:precorrin-3B C(17)-methyltransferase n=1 Tax=Thermovenabulum sp. TaxID=3100335 RepID=UPI003C7E8559